MSNTNKLKNDMVKAMQKKVVAKKQSIVVVEEAQPVVAKQLPPARKFITDPRPGSVIIEEYPSKTTTPQNKMAAGFASVKSQSKVIEEEKVLTGTERSEGKKIDYS